MVTDQIEEFRNKLAGNEKAEQLLEELRSHFGSDLRFEVQQAKKPCSGVGYCYKEMPPLCKIVVTAHLKPGAIVHELLHVKMYKNGFPVPVPASPINASEKEAVCEAVNLGNAVSHPMFIEEFEDLGFDKQNEFFFQADELQNMAQVENQLDDNLKDPASFSFWRGDWNRLCLTEWISDQMGVPHQTEQFMEIGRRKFAEMDADAAWCKSWFHCGDFRVAEKHAGAITEFMKHFGLPVAKFGKLEPIGNQIQLT